MTLLGWLGAGIAGAWSLCLAASALVPGPELDRSSRTSGRLRAGRVSVIVPMRDEAGNAEACIADILAQDDVDLELVVVDDGSTDETGALARAGVAGDRRARVVDAEPLPPGWVGKPWACHQGARETSGTWLLFVDADVRLDPKAVATLLDDADARDAVVISAVGYQELATFWERVINPVVFLFIASLTPLPLARRPSSRIVAVNGQLLGFRRAAYEALGGHEAVRDAVVEDLALGRAAKARFGTGYRFVWARELFSTRMYTSLADIREGWSKNLALGGQAVGVPPPLVVGGALVGGTLPWLGLAVLPVAPWLWPWALAALFQALALGIFTHRFSGRSPLWGATAPLGTTAVVGITIASWRRTAQGSLRWRGRAYGATR
jgi:cellulose synthase/poly-beta-1,6-N-acetylglucosamine synthase-like glycosyltransferase